MRLEAGRIVPEKQDPAQATYARVLQKEDGKIDWRLQARQIANRVRGFDPWPGAYTSFRGHLLHLRRVRVQEGSPGEPGALAVEGGTLRAACGSGWLELLELQPEGRKRMTAQEFINGRRPVSGELLGL